MNLNLNRQDAETVIQVTFSEGMSDQQIVDAFMDSVQMACAEPHGQTVYRVFDVRQAESRAATVVGMIAEMTRGLVGATVHPQTNLVIVAQPSFVNPTSMRVFNSTEAALAHIHAHPLPSAA